MDNSLLPSFPSCGAVGAAVKTKTALATWLLSKAKARERPAVSVQRTHMALLISVQVLLLIDPERIFLLNT